MPGLVLLCRNDTDKRIRCMYMRANNNVDKQCTYPIIFADTGSFGWKDGKRDVLRFLSVAIIHSRYIIPLVRGVSFQEIMYGIVDSSAVVFVV